MNAIRIRSWSIQVRWWIVRRLLRAAQRVAVRPSEYGNHLNQAIEGWFFYIRNGAEGIGADGGRIAVELSPNLGDGRDQAAA